ncbi:MAG: hypothetical protein GKR94_19260 [Gammaproteobacteria bacterium]|nr:hypothetical protein [Gammaproteobacteria bacterium]
MSRGRNLAGYGFEPLAALDEADRELCQLRRLLGLAHGTGLLDEEDYPDDHDHSRPPCRCGLSVARRRLSR